MTVKRILFFAGLSLLASGCSQLPDVKGTTSPTQPLATIPVELVANPNLEGIQWSDKTCSIERDALLEYELGERVDLWDRVREGFVLPEYHNERIQQEISWYARHPSYMKRVTERGRPYLHHIVEELQARGMPMEFALLPIVESAFDPFAYSHGRASGMWQFVPGTGKWLGLKQNWWYDGRRDVMGSTDAALRYLDHLANAFDGDWLLALAAYNAGRGNVSKAIRRNRNRGKPTDFWSLDLPRETEAYVPRLLALKKLVLDPAAHNLTLTPVPNKPYFVAIDVGSQIDLAQAAEMAGMSMEDFYLLNPGFNRWATDPQGPHQLLVPIERAEQFKKRLAALPANQRVTWDRYRIKAGDTLSTIAAQYNTSISGLKAVNGLSGEVIRQGDVLMVPVAAEEDSHYAFSVGERLKDTRSRVAKQAEGKKVMYEVQAGDSFWTISRRYEVSVRELAKWNGMAPGDPLRIGQKLAIWTAKADAAPLTASQGVVRKVSYRVRQGDSLYRIANRFRVSVADIRRWNQLSSAKYLQPGQALTLFVDVTD